VNTDGAWVADGTGAWNKRQHTGSEMVTRARELLNRSRALLDRSREAAAQFLATPPQSPRPRLVLPPPPPPPAAVSPPEIAHRPTAEDDDTLAAVCANVALRDLNLVDSLLSQLEEMEAKEEDTVRLAALYHLDHLATRLRRNAENLRVLAGRDATEAAPDTTSLVDAVRAGMSSIDQYSRVTIGRVVTLGVVGFAAEDLGRLLAELLDNATKSSPPNTSVRVSAHLTEKGSVLMRIEDEGIGLPPDRLEQLNERLSGAPVLDDESVRHMGLAVVRRVAARHDIHAWLDRRVPHGTTASVLLPASLIAELPETSWSGTETVTFPAAGPGVSRRETARRDMAAPPPSRPAPPKSAPQPRLPISMVGGSTSSGLPRRISHSLKETTEQASPPPEKPRPSTAEGHAKLLADLDAFTDGEREARQARTNAEDKKE
jgi:signal transduction histidine kinase